MSISAPGGNQGRPIVVSNKKTAAGDKPAEVTRQGASRPGGGPAAGRPGAKSGGKKGKKVTAVKVGQSRAWGPIAMFAAVGLLAAGIIGYGAWAAFQGAKPWDKRAADIAGIANIRESDPESLEYERHQAGPIEYTKYVPPVGGVHNDSWQNCMGDVYDAPIASEHAVHSLEHGAVWVTYRPDLPADQVETLAAKVRGKEKMLMSPFEGLDAPISLQAWGYQLKVDDASDGRIDEFIQALRVNASVEGPTALCNQGITATGTTPRDLGQQMQQ